MVNFVPRKLDLSKFFIKVENREGKTNSCQKQLLNLFAATYLTLPTYVLLAREKSSATKEMMKSVLVALLIFLAASNSLSFSSSAVM